MNSPSSVSGATSSTPAVAGGRTAPLVQGGGFHDAFASALGNAAATDGRSAGAAHVVKRGETLYGIARARLTAAGEASTPAAVMQYALDIARANHIRNPDRIQPGQQIVLRTASPATEGGSRHVESLASAKRAWTIDETAQADAPNEADPAGTITAVDAEQGITTAASSSSCEASECGVAPSMAPDRFRSEPSGRTSSPVANDSPSDRLGSMPSRAALALYEQTAPAPAPAPSAWETTQPSAAVPSLPEAPIAKPVGNVPDIFYKGVVGKALDLVPLDPDTRTGLQQANAVVSGSVVGRTLAALTGVGGPILTVAGLVWGLVSARKIGDMKPEEPKQVAQNANASPLN